MYRDFIVKQTSDYPSQFKPKTLVGNWYEERCNPHKVENFHFYKERKDLNEAHKPTLTQVALPLFRITSNNLRVTGSIFNSTTPIRDNFVQSNEQKRLSVLNPFITKKSEFDKNADALDEYR